MKKAPARPRRPSFVAASVKLTAARPEGEGAMGPSRKPTLELTPVKRPASGGGAMAAATITGAKGSTSTPSDVTAVRRPARFSALTARRMSGPFETPVEGRVVPLSAEPMGSKGPAGPHAPLPACTWPAAS